jgi:hypothetical protein
LKQKEASQGNGGMTTETDMLRAKLKERFKRAQPLPQWTGAPAQGNYAARACPPACTLPPRATLAETTAAPADAVAAVPGSSLWIGLGTARDAAKEGIALGVLALAAVACVVQAFSDTGEGAPGLVQICAQAGRLAG